MEVIAGGVKEARQPIFRDIRCYYCEYCGLSRSKKSLIASHIISHHQDETEEGGDDKEEKEQKQDASKSSNTCEECGVKWVIKADKHNKIKFCCRQSKAAVSKWSYVALKETMLFLFVEAALRVMSYLPLPYSALATLSVVPVPLRDAVYDYVAKRRLGNDGKSDKCLVMKDKEMLERFIDRDEILNQLSRADSE